MGRFGGRGGGGRGKKANGGKGGKGSGGGQGGVDKDAQFTPFLYPTPRQLHPVPLEFQSVAHFAMLIGNNLLAEFWHLIQEGPRGPAIKAMPASDGKLNLVNDAGVGGEEASLIHHLLLINRQLHLVVGQTGGERDPVTGDKSPVLLSLKPKLNGFQGQIRSFGYVGSFVAELAALQVWLILPFYFVASQSWSVSVSMSGPRLLCPFAKRFFFFLQTKYPAPSVGRSTLPRSTSLRSG